MIIDCRTWKFLPDRGMSQRHEVYVDGSKVQSVWYVDTEQGFVKTYFSGLIGFIRELYPAEWELEVDGTLVVRTIRGKVELKPIHGMEPQNHS